MAQRWIRGAAKDCVVNWRKALTHHKVPRHATPCILAFREGWRHAPGRHQNPTEGCHHSLGMAGCGGDAAEGAGDHVFVASKLRWDRDCVVEVRRDDATDTTQQHKELRATV